jgi:uncharacterized membrane protein
MSDDDAVLPVRPSTPDAQPDWLAQTTAYLVSVSVHDIDHITVSQEQILILVTEQGEYISSTIGHVVPDSPE